MQTSRLKSPSANIQHHFCGSKSKTTMVQISTMQAVSPLETVPLEVLNNILTFVCYDSIDLSILQTSKSLQWKLRGHPIVQALRSFCTPGEMLDLLGFCFDAAATAVHVLGCQCGDLVNKTSTDPTPTNLRRLYSIPGLLKCIQIVMLKRIVLQAWMPFLRRDGVETSGMSTQMLQKFLDSTIPPNSGMTERIALKDIIFIDSNSKYSWTRLHVMPSQTRLVIRDQLFNTEIEKQVPLLQEIWC